MNDDAPKFRTSKGLSLALWVVQALLFATFLGTGIWKLTTSRSVLGQTFPWMAEVPAGLFYATAVFDVLGGLGVLLPSLTRVKPSLVRLAALGCAALQGSAILFHVARGEAENTPFNILLVALSLFVLWGRRRDARP